MNTIVDSKKPATRKLGAMLKRDHMLASRYEGGSLWLDMLEFALGAFRHSNSG